jgi:outer membrane protein OmpA-like peptidoglycan-associated protein
MHSAASSSPHPAADTERSAPSVNLTVMFANGSAKLTPAATRTLDDLGHALGNSSLVGYKFRIEGHTDTLGNADLNKALSESRAEAVVDYLVSKFNIDRSRLTPVGMGEEGLLVQTPPETSEPRNRRVQVVNLGS